MVARALDGWWEEMGRPDPFVVVEAGAGTGMLARTVLLAEPACATALRYVLVERSAALRVEHGRSLDLTPPAFGLGPARVDADGIERPSQVGVGPVVVSLGELPSLDRPVVVLANELLDNLAFRVLAPRASGAGRRCGSGIDPDEVRLTEVLVPAEDDQVRLIGCARARRAGRVRACPCRTRPDAGCGGPSTSPRPAAGWCASTTPRRTAELAARPLDGLAADLRRPRPRRDRRSNASASRTSPPTSASTSWPGSGRRPASARQAEWLRAHGIDELVDEGRRVWSERAAVADLEALRARSRVSEAEALLDPTGLGGFRVLEWQA